MISCHLGGIYGVIAFLSRDMHQGLAGMQVIKRICVLHRIDINRCQSSVFCIDTKPYTCICGRGLLVNCQKQLSGQWSEVEFSHSDNPIQDERRSWTVLVATSVYVYNFHNY